MGYCYDHRGRLCCDSCGGSGKTRKVKCPFGYCPAVALCPTCKKKHAYECSKEAHREQGCEKRHNEFVAEQAKKEEMLKAGKYLRCSALTYKTHGVHVLFRNAERKYIGRYMSHETYDAIDGLTTPEDYAKIGETHWAPDDFDIDAAYGLNSV